MQLTNLNATHTILCNSRKLMKFTQLNSTRCNSRKMSERTHIARCPCLPMNCYWWKLGPGFGEIPVNRCCGSSMPLKVPIRFVVTNKHQLSVNFHLFPQQNNQNYCIKILAIKFGDINIIIAVLIVLVIICDLSLWWLLKGEGNIIYRASIHHWILTEHQFIIQYQCISLPREYFWAGEYLQNILMFHLSQGTFLCGKYSYQFRELEKAFKVSNG